jgi:hypothetical protein
MARIFTAFALAILALLNTACVTLQTTVNPGKLQIGFEPTWATNKSKPVCGWNESNYRSGGTKSHSSSQSCTESYELGDMLCTRSWQQNYQVVNAPGKQNDSQSSGYSTSQPSCRPMTKVELEERAERRRQAAEAAKAASAAKK